MRLFPKQDFNRCKGNQPGARTYWISSVVISPRLLKLVFPFLVFLADCDLKATINKKPPRKVYQWSKADWQLIKEQTVIFAKQFLALALTRTVKENYTVFIEYMEGILTVNIPSKLLNSRHNLPWINRNLKRLIRKKGRRFKKAKKSGMDEDRGSYMDIEQMVKRELRDAEMVYVNGILQNGRESGNNKPFWKYVKSQKQETWYLCS